MRRVSPRRFHLGARDTLDSVSLPPRNPRVKSASIVLQQGSHRLRQYFQLTKPLVVSLIVFCAVIGMFLAVPGMVP